MEDSDLIPVIVLRVNAACCKDCPEILQKALLKLEGVFKVDFDSEFKQVCIRSTLDPSMIIKRISKMNKNAELIFYDKEPVLNLKQKDHDHNHHNPSREQKTRAHDHHQNFRRNGKEKEHNTSDDQDHRKKKNYDRGNNGKKRFCFCADDDDADELHKEEKDHHHGQYFSRNFREPGWNYGSDHVREDSSSIPPGRYDYGCCNYDKKKTPETFFESDDDVFKTCGGWGRRGTRDQNMQPPPMEDQEPMFMNKEDHCPGDNFCSKSCRSGGQNFTRPNWCNSTMPPSYEHYSNSSKPPPYDQRYGSFMPPPPPHTRPHRMPPYYSDFSDENPNGCIIM